jgi:large subunit ribosomal protein L35
MKVKNKVTKLKNKKGLVKRVKVTKKGKALQGARGRRHLLSGKTAKRKRHLRKKRLFSSAEQKIIKLGVPYV